MEKSFKMKLEAYFIYLMYYIDHFLYKMISTIIIKQNKVPIYKLRYRYIYIFVFTDLPIIYTFYVYY